MLVSSCFDAGAIEVLRAEDPADIHLNIRRDSHADFRQWFYLRLSGVRDTAVTLHFDNAGSCTYHYGWDGYQALASHDREHWFRVPTQYENGVLTVRFTAAADHVWLAYFEPYGEQRHHDFLARCARHPAVRLLTPGVSVQGRPIDIVRIGEPGAGRRPVWIVARQHPGETMAQWCAEGLMERLLDNNDPVSRALLECAVFYIVPNINPDGSALGNLRSNAAGANLNREWLSPSMERSPEVLFVRDMMHQTGVAAFIDLHGDETIPHVFVDGNGMLPNWTPALQRREQAFVEALLQATPDFQVREGYAPDRFSDEMLTLASKYIGHAFACLSLTLEMPFKDHLDNPHPHTGWSAARSKRLGEALLWPLLRDLRSLA